MEFIEVEAWFGNRSFYLHPSVKREEVLKIGTFRNQFIDMPEEIILICSVVNQ